MFLSSAITFAQSPRRGTECAGRNKPQLTVKTNGWPGTAGDESFFIVPYDSKWRRLNQVGRETILVEFYPERSGVIAGHRRDD